MRRSPDFKNQMVRVVFERPPAAGRVPPRKAPPPKAPPLRVADRVLQLELGSKPSERLVLDAPVLTSLGGGGEREKRRPVALSVIPDRVKHAVLAIQESRVYEH